MITLHTTYPQSMPYTANVQNFRMKPAGELLKLLSIFVLPKDLTTAKNINIRIFSTAIDFHYIQSLQLLTFRSHTP